MCLAMQGGGLREKVQLAARRESLSYTRRHADKQRRDGHGRGAQRVDESIYRGATHDSSRIRCIVGISSGSHSRYAFEMNRRAPLLLTSSFQEPSSSTVQRVPGTVFLHSCPPLSSIVLGEPGRGIQPNRVAFDARSQFDREEAKGRFMSLVLRCNDRRSFSAVESMPPQNSLIGLFQLSIRRRRMALDLPCPSSWPSQPEQWHEVAAHFVHFASAHRAHERDVSMPPPPSADAFYIGWNLRPRPEKCSTRLPSAPRTPVCERRHPRPAFQAFDQLHVMDLCLCGKT